MKLPAPLAVLALSLLNRWLVGKTRPRQPTATTGRPEERPNDLSTNTDVRAKPTCRAIVQEHFPWLVSLAVDTDCKLFAFVLYIS